MEAPLIEFYKARIAYFYGGNVEMADFANIDEVIRRETNRRGTMKTDNAVTDFMHHDHPKPEAPMALYAANYFKVIKVRNSRGKRKSFKYDFYSRVCPLPFPTSYPR